MQEGALTQAFCVRRFGRVPKRRLDVDVRKDEKAGEEGEIRRELILATVLQNIAEDEAGDALYQ